MVCHGCGGVVGRDCFNPQECEQITRSMADHSHELEQQLCRVHSELQEAREDLKRLVAFVDSVISDNNLELPKGVSIYSILQKWRGR